jgi:hypothetical protein
LLVGEELDGGVGEDTEESGRVALEQASGTFIALDVADGGRETGPAAGVLGKLGIGCLEEDLDAIERRNDRFGLDLHSISKRP